MNSLSKALPVFLSQMIDYAGLYPPASLPLDEAIRNFVNYQNDAEVWMLSRFIIPARRLAELSILAESMFPTEGTLSFSALGRGGTNGPEFIQNLEIDLFDINIFRTLHEPVSVIDMFETALPTSELDQQISADKLVQDATNVLQQEGLFPFFEAPFGDGWQPRAERLITSLQQLNNQQAGFKLRTGGVEPEAFPSPEQAAWAIGAARNAGIPLKATAGLHHPIRHYNESVRTKMHGFLNVFGAGILAITYGINQNQIQEILEDENPEHFIFNDSGFSWKNFTANLEQIEQARQHGFVSFGSCSFDEPREDLQTLGLLVN